MKQTLLQYYLGLSSRHGKAAILVAVTEVALIRGRPSETDRIAWTELKSRKIMGVAILLTLTSH